MTMKQYFPSGKIIDKLAPIYKQAIDFFSLDISKFILYFSNIKTSYAPNFRYFQEHSYLNITKLYKLIV